MAATACEKRPPGFLRGALEHQVFEEMREPRFAGRLVGGADLVPDHVRHDRRAMIRHHDDFEPVGEREVGDLARWRAPRRRRERPQSAARATRSASRL